MLTLFRGGTGGSFLSSLTPSLIRSFSVPHTVIDHVLIFGRLGMKEGRSRGGIYRYVYVVYLEVDYIQFRHRNWGTVRGHGTGEVNKILQFFFFLNFTRNFFYSLNLLRLTQLVKIYYERYTGTLLLTSRNSESRK